MPWTWRYEKADGTVISTDELQEAIFGSSSVLITVPSDFSYRQVQGISG